MNGINRRGQRVECICTVTGHVGGVEGTFPGWPKAGQFYIVDDFIHSKTERGRTPGITLLGVKVIRRVEDYSPVGWPIECFRPVNERKTDISALVGHKLNEPA